MKSLEDHGNPFHTLFGLPPNPKAPVVVLPVLWDVTTSFSEGTHKAPEAILKVSHQMDLFSPLWERFDVFMESFPKEKKKENKLLRKLSKKIFKTLETKDTLCFSQRKDLETINKASENLNHWVYEKSLSYLKENRFVGVLGGDHSSPLGLIKALGETQKEESFGILHIDAHADLREAYCGFTYSHASIMNQVLKLPQPPSKITQVGLRDFSFSEYETIKKDKRLELFCDFDLRQKKSQGKSWHDIALDILDTLPKNVYVSFDIDGLEPSFCPDTGTPVPGGLSFSESLYLLELLVGHHKNPSPKKLIGFDLVEVCPSKYSLLNEIVGARLLFYLCGLIQNQKG